MALCSLQMASIETTDPTQTVQCFWFFVFCLHPSIRTANSTCYQTQFPTCCTRSFRPAPCTPPPPACHSHTMPREQHITTTSRPCCCFITAATLADPLSPCRHSHPPPCQSLTASCCPAQQRQQPFQHPFFLLHHPCNTAAIVSPSHTLTKSFQPPLLRSHGSDGAMSACSCRTLALLPGCVPLSLASTAWGGVAAVVPWVP